MATYKELLKRQRDAGQVKSITPQFMRFEKPGQEIVGTFKGINTVNSSYGEGNYNQYLFETDDGLKKFNMGKQADTEIGLQLVEGYIYYIRYDGKEEIGQGRRVNKFYCELIGDPADLESFKDQEVQNEQTQDTG